MNDFERIARETSIRISDEGDILPLQDYPDLYSSVDEGLDDDPDPDPEELESDDIESTEPTLYDKLKQKFVKDINSRRESGKPARVNWLGNWVSANRALELAQNNTGYRNITNEQWQALAKELSDLGLKIDITNQNLGNRAIGGYTRRVPINGNRVADWAERAAGDYEIEDRPE